MEAKKKYADKYAAITPKDYKQLEDRLKKVLQIFSNHEFDKILDVGCGDGNFSVLLREACGAKEVYGIEISEKAMESANKNGVKAYQLNIDEDDFPFEDNYFDAIFAGEVIEHLFDPDHFLDGVYRTLRGGGLLVLSTPNLAWWINKIAIFFGFQPYSMNVSSRYSIGHIYEGKNIITSFDHIRLFTLRSLKPLLMLHGFHIKEVKGVHMSLI